MKKTITEIRDYLLENRTDKNGDLDLIGLDFSEFEGDVYISWMKVKKNRFSSYNEVEGNNYQSYNKVKGNNYQSYNKVDCDLYDYNNSAKNHKIWKDGYWETIENSPILKQKSSKELLLETLNDEQKELLKKVLGE